MGYLGKHIPFHLFQSSRWPSLVIAYCGKGKASAGVCRKQARSSSCRIAGCKLTSVFLSLYLDKSRKCHTHLMHLVAKQCVVGSALTSNSPFLPTDSRPAFSLSCLHNLCRSMIFAEEGEVREGWEAGKNKTHIQYSIHLFVLENA